MVLGLIFMGALVTSHDAGLSVPDWPTTFGENMFLYPPSKWEGGVFFEHTHRLVASLIGLLTIILAVSIQRGKYPVSLKYCGWLALLMVIVQGILGGMTVRFLLPTALSVFHGVLGQSFLLFLIWIAYRIHCVHELPVSRFSVGGKSLRFFVLLPLLLYFQLILGAVVRHTESGLAIPDFPTSGGKWIPEFTEDWLSDINQWRKAHHLVSVTLEQAMYHFSHRVCAGIIVLIFVMFSFKCFKAASSRGAMILTTVWTGFILMTALFGPLLVLSRRHPYITSAHVVFAATALALSFLMYLIILKNRTTRL